MILEIRAFQPQDVPELVQTWNEIVEEGTAFPQMAPLNIEMGAKFFENNLLLPWHMIQSVEKLLGCIFYIQTMSDAVGISVMPAMRSNLVTEGSISENSLCCTVCRKQENWAFGFYSLMRLYAVTKQHENYMISWALQHWARYRTVSCRRTELIPILCCIIYRCYHKSILIYIVLARR